MRNLSGPNRLFLVTLALVFAYSLLYHLGGNNPFELFPSPLVDVARWFHFKTVDWIGFLRNNDITQFLYSLSAALWITITVGVFLGLMKITFTWIMKGFSNQKKDQNL